MAIAAAAALLQPAPDESPACPIFRQAIDLVEEAQVEDEYFCSR